MSDIINIIKSLPRLSYIEGASKSAISDAEAQLCLGFSSEYLEYLSEFGSIAAKGIELTGIINADYCNVVSVTKQEWLLNPKIPHNMYVIENTCVDGIIIWQDANGYIYQSTPNSKPKQIAQSLAEYILKRIR